MPMPTPISPSAPAPGHESSLTLEADSYTQLASWLDQGGWVVACLCAAWCDTCRSYRRDFDQLATAHPDKRFIWIDVEDRADLVGDIDVDNFPTLLIQRGDDVAFFGTVLPEAKLADRLIQAQAEKSDTQLDADRTLRAFSLRPRLAASA